MLYLGREQPTQIAENRIIKAGLRICGHLLKISNSPWLDVLYMYVDHIAVAPTAAAAAAETVRTGYWSWMFHAAR